MAITKRLFQSESKIFPEMGKAGFKGTATAWVHVYDGDKFVESYRKDVATGTCSSYFEAWVQLCEALLTLLR